MPENSAVMKPASASGAVIGTTSGSTGTWRNVTLCSSGYALTSIDVSVGKVHPAVEDTRSKQLPSMV